MLVCHFQRNILVCQCSSFCIPPLCKGLCSYSTYTYLYLYMYSEWSSHEYSSAILQQKIRVKRTRVHLLQSVLFPPHALHAIRHQPTTCSFSKHIIGAQCSSKLTCLLHCRQSSSSGAKLRIHQWVQMHPQQKRNLALTISYSPCVHPLNQGSCTPHEPTWQHESLSQTMPNK